MKDTELLNQEEENRNNSTNIPSNKPEEGEIQPGNCSKETYPECKEDAEDCACEKDNCNCDE